MHKPKRINLAKSMVMIPLYKQRVVEDKLKYNRKEKHKNEGNQHVRW
jgi:hypothetical protein